MTTWKRGVGKGQLRRVDFENSRLLLAAFLARALANTASASSTPAPYFDSFAQGIQQRPVSATDIQHVEFVRIQADAGSARPIHHFAL